MVVIFIGIRFCEPNFIKIRQFSLRFDILCFNDFKMAAIRHLGFLKFAVYVTTFFGMPFCFILQKFAKIRRSLAELCPKTVFKMSFNYFWSRDCHRVQNLTLFTEIWWLTIFKMAAVRNHGFSKLAVFVMWPLTACRSASLYKISLKSNNPFMTYGQKSDFQDGGRLPSWILKILIIGQWSWLSSGALSAVVYQMSSKSDNVLLRYGDLTIFKMAALRHLGFLKM